MAILSILIPALMAQGTVDGPALGVVWDGGAKAVRLVAGIPGSAVIGSKFDSPVPFQVAESSDGHAVALSAEGSVYRLGRAGWTRENLPEGATRLRLSAGGEAAAILYPGGVVRVVRPGAETREIRLDIEKPLMALNDDATLLLAASGCELWMVNEAGNRWKHEFEGTVLDVAFSRRAGTVLVGTANGMWLIEDAAGAGSRRLVWEGEAAFVNSARVGAVALAAVRNQARVIAIDLDSGAQRTVETPVNADALSRLGSGDVFRLTGPDAELAWMLDWSKDEPRTFFLPRRVEEKE